MCSIKLEIDRVRGNALCHQNHKIAGGHRPTAELIRRGYAVRVDLPDDEVRLDLDAGVVKGGSHDVPFECLVAEGGDLWEGSDHRDLVLLRQVLG